MKSNSGLKIKSCFISKDKIVISSLLCSNVFLVFCLFTLFSIPFYHYHDTNIVLAFKPTVSDNQSSNNNNIELNQYKLVKMWGSKGAEDGVFDNPEDIAIDFSSGNKYVVDNGNHRIQKFDSNDVFITKWGSAGTGNGKFGSPQGIAIDSSGNVYVVDTQNNNVQKFDSNGKFITK